MGRVSTVLLASMLFLAVANQLCANATPPAPELKELDHFWGSGTMDGDAKNKVYTYDSFSSVDEHNVATATLDGGTWSGQFDVHKLEFSQDGTNWNLAMEGKATRK